MRALICFLADAELAIRNVATVKENSALKGTASFPGSATCLKCLDMLEHATKDHDTSSSESNRLVK
jgi:hypothetical protein